MKFLLLQIENRSNPLLNAFMEHNRRVAAKYEFEYVQINTTYDENLPPYWWKVFALRNIMYDRPDVDLVMWLDSDAFLAQYDTRNPVMIAESDPDHEMWVSPDTWPDPWSFNAGSFVVRNSPTGRAIMDKWVSLYNPARWNKVQGKWKADGPWAGPDYEQGSFANNIQDDASFRIKTFPSYVLSNTSCKNIHPDTVSVHTYGGFKDIQGPSCLLLLGAANKQQQNAALIGCVVLVIVVIVVIVLVITLANRPSKK